MAVRRRALRVNAPRGASSTVIPRDYVKAGRWARVKWPNMDKERHLNEAHILANVSADFNRKLQALLNREDKAAGIKPGSVASFQRISGGSHRSYSQSAKDRVRALNEKMNRASTVSFAHYAAAGKHVTSARADFKSRQRDLT